MILRSPTENENADLRHAGMDGRHPGSQDAPETSMSNLDSSTPCWNDVIESFRLKVTHPISKESTKEEEFTTETRSSQIGLFLDQKLFPLRPQRLRGAIFDSSWESRKTSKYFTRLARQSLSFAET
jgi:hypothetical protein